MSENGLPPGWTFAPLGTVADVLGGGTPPRAEPDNFGGEIVWLTPTEVPKQTVGIVSDSKEKLTEKGLTSGGIRWIPKGSVLMTSRASIGFVAIAGERLTTNQGFASFVLRDGMEPKFLGWWLRSQKSRLEDEAGGTTFKEISKAKLKNIPAPIAPANEQGRIVAAIEEQFTLLDAGVAALERTRANLKRYRASVLKAAVEGRLTERWREEHPDTEDAETLLKRILEERRARWEGDQLARYAGKEQNPPKNWRAKYKEPGSPNTTDLPELLERWVWTSTNALMVSLRSGSSAVPHDQKVGVPVLRSSSVRPGVINFEDVRYLDEEKLIGENFLREQDLLFTRLSGSLDYVGNCAVVRSLEDRKIQYPDRLFCAKLVDPKLVSFVSWYFSSPPARKTIKTAAKSTAGHQRISQDAITEHVLPLPPLAEQEEIVAEVEMRLSVVEGVEAQVEAGLKRAARLRQAILKRAFEGRLVPQDPDDEPAEALLEQIREEREQSLVKKAGRKKPTKRNAKEEQTSLFSTEGG